MNISVTDNFTYTDFQLSPIPMCVYIYIHTHKCIYICTYIYTQNVYLCWQKEESEKEGERKTFFLRNKYIFLKLHHIVFLQLKKPD